MFIIYTYSIGPIHHYQCKIVILIILSINIVMLLKTKMQSYV